MPRVTLTGGAYEARSLIAAAQRCVNLYPEINPPASQSPVPVTHYPTPGLVGVYQFSGGAAQCRGIYFATSNQIYAVFGTAVVAISSGGVETRLGTIAAGTSMVSMADNAVTLVLVDGTASGYTINLATNAFAPIVSTAFYGADFVAYVDTFFVFNKIATQQFYISDSQATTFNPLNFAAKVGAPDLLVGVICVFRTIWLIGERTTEIWTSSGSPDFPFQIMTGAFIEHGCQAKYSIAKADTSAFWLSQDKQGGGIVMRGSGYSAKRISTHAIEAEFNSYTTLSDAIGFTYQIGGHTFYVLTFPTADETWAYDVATELWHELAWMDPAGALHRHRASCATAAYNGAILMGDYANGKIYRAGLDLYSDDGQPVQRIRSFPHMVNDGDRVFYLSFIADMEGGTTTGATPPVLSLRYSDTRGATWGTPVLGDLGARGDFATSAQFNRLGMGRDRVFEVSWTSPARTALNGAFLTTKTAAS